MSVIEIVARETRRAARAVQVAGIALPLGVGATLLAVGAMWLARGRWLALPPVVPFLVWGSAIAGAVIIARAIRVRLASRATSPAVAHAIEEEQQLRRGSLTGFLEVASEGGAFIERAAERLGTRLADVTARPAPRHRRRLRRAAILSTLVLAQVLVLVGTSWARRPDGWLALLSPMAAWRGTLLPPLEVTESPRLLRRGATADFVVTAPDRREVTLHWRATGGAWRDTSLLVDAESRAAFSLPAVDADLALFAGDGRTESDTAFVRVVDRPFVGDVSLRATYPAYLGRITERLPADAPLRIPAGTRLTIEGHASEELAAVALVAGGVRLPLRAQGTTFTGAFTPQRSGSWSWEARGTSSEIADLPGALEIEVLADSAPHVEILDPTGEALVGSRDRVGIEILAQDDHALAGVWLRRWIVSPEGTLSEPVEIRLSASRDGEWLGGAVQELGPLLLEPGSQVHFVAVARDAAPFDREGLSERLVLRIPTVGEERSAARDAGDAAVEAATSAARAQAALEQRTENASKSRPDRQTTATPNTPGQPQAQQPNQQGMAFENSERAREIAEQQRAMQERVKGLEEAAAEMEERLRRAGALDTALARQLQEAQRLLREAMTPEMQEALRRLEGSSQQLDGDRTRQSLADLAAQQQKMREALEKSAEMLKRAALEGSMQTLADQAKELAEAQQAYADSARGTVPDTNRAERLSRQARDLSKAIETLKERLEQQRANTGATGAERAQEEAQRSEQALQQAMQQARSASGAQGDQARQRAQESAQQAAQAMQDAAESLKQARQGQVSEWKGELTDAIDKSVQEMLQLAREQDQLAEKAQRDPNDPNLRGQQSALQQGVQTAQQRLNQESRRSALVSPRTQQLMDQAQQRVSQAAKESAQSQRGQSGQAMQEAADALRQAAAQLTRDRERANNAQSASGLPEMIEQMQQLAQQQGALNGQMQSLFAGQQGNKQQGLDAASRSQAREMAKSQRDVARALDEVADTDPTGRAAEMARDARQLAQALDQGVADAATQARQERLFRRMLDAGRSLEQEQKDESQRRESRAARGIGSFTPPGGPARGKDAERFAVPTWEELRGLSADERRLVIEYFRRLNAEKAP